MANVQTHELSNTNRAVIQGFRDLVGDRYFLSDDNQWSRRLVYYHLLKYRALILEQRLTSRKTNISLFNRQTIPCIPLEETDVHDCPCVPVSGCTFLKTVYPVPAPLGSSYIVTAIDGSVNYQFVEWERMQYNLTSRVIADRSRPYFTIKKIDKRYFIYLYNDKHKKFITVTAIFEEPLLIQVYPDCEGNIDACFRPMDQEFILDNELVPYMYEMALKSLFPAKEQATSDIINNDIPDSTAKTVK